MKNSKTSQVQYRDFSLEIHRKAEDSARPIYCQFELTFACNLKCCHCYVAKEPGKKELSYAEITNILDEIQQAGCLWLTLTGGEPLMRRDFLDIYRYAKRKGFIIIILSNATLITKKIADYLQEYPPLYLDITLNGISEDTYERVTGIKGSFKKCMAGINLLLERKLPFKIKTQAITLNRHELGKIKAYAQGLGLEFKLDGTIFPKLNGSCKPCDLRLSPEEALDLYRFYRDRQECKEKAGENEYVYPETLFRCGAGTNSFHISPYAELLFCTFHRRPGFNLRSGSFKQGFRLLQQIRNLKFKSESQCKECKIWHLCLRCPAMSGLEKGDYEAPVEYFCNLAHQVAGVADG